VLPLIFEGQVKGVLELASFDGFNPSHHALLDQLTESIGIVLNTIEANMRTEGLLQQSQSLAQQLQSRQEQLQQTNQELQEKARLLAQQNQEVEFKNSEVEQARQQLEEKAKQLSITSKYKSEFMANMSHELRTPLNSLLILSDQLSNNPQGNLTPRQTEFAKTIHSAGNELLMLINDILDLSKIESGTVVVDASELRLDDLQGYVERTFRHVAESKNLAFHIQFGSTLPKSLYTDSKRLQQIIKNLLSNAFKFTQHGHVTLSVDIVQAGWSMDNDSLNRSPEVVAFTVADTGIGIPADKQQIIFEAFQQADGSTSRKYGGTGLGLAISRELSRLLGGEISLVSMPGQGSTFVLYLPTSYSTPRGTRRLGVADPAADAPASRLAALPSLAAALGVAGRLGTDGASTAEFPTEQLPNEIGDDRDEIRPGDRVLLIVENDVAFSRFLLDTAREMGFKGLVTSLGATALALTREYNPHAITLDLHLPDIDGWRVLDRLKNDLATRHIPVCVVSTDEARDRALSSGAFLFLAKPLQSRDLLDRMLSTVVGFIDRSTRHLLVFEPDESRRSALLEELQSDHVKIGVAADVETAVRMLYEQEFDCLVATSVPPELSQVLVSDDDSVEGDGRRLPVVVYSPGASGDAEWQRPAGTCTVKQVRSTDRLRDAAAFCLHANVESLPQPQQKQLRDLHCSDRSLQGKKVLLVDDDMRNIFALATVLEEHQMVVVSADNGRDAISLLQNDPSVEIVLMDIMMPEMDGMETMRVIRKIPQLKNLPIIAVTAKAMKGDREKCIEAGAWDYLSKPVDVEQMLSSLRAWLHR
jgi:signal transduction histidine kinase/DNA-binding response OmpR family regulator